VAIDPEREITVTCGSTEAMIATLLAVVDPGDEVVVFEPFYENYGPDACSAARRRASCAAAGGGRGGGAPGPTTRTSCAAPSGAHARRDPEHAEQPTGRSSPGAS